MVPFGSRSPEYASRDGTDYGLVERSLEEKVASLRAQLADGSVCLMYDADSETWDLVPREQREAMQP